MVEKKKTTKAPAAKKSSRAAAPKKKAAAAPEKKAAAPAPPPRVARPQKPKKAAAARPADARPAATGVHDLAPAVGATHYRKRVGRGPGSGHGKTAGRGQQGQEVALGLSPQRGFEGGQMPLQRRLPKRGFTNIFRVEYEIVNLADLDRFEAGAAVNPETLVASRLARKNRPVKILGDGKIQKALTVSAHKFSASAKAGIEAAGGRCEVLSR